MLRTASTDLFAKACHWFPARLTCTYTLLPSPLCTPLAVSGSPQ
ncbi:Uncharacterised protein [Mycobacteroides abscessus subsp. abscessus]|nr:Uncharacterised protein [Mycobacteroides abscessus subsp. abscessus]